MKTLLTALLLTCSMTVFAQVDAPQPSPNASLTQVVGLSEVSVAYSRPSAKGRTIFGDLVPYNKKWRTGANENTLITFSDDVEIGEQILSAGSYAIFSVPKKESWDIYFYDKLDNWGLPKLWNEESVAAMVNVPTKSLNHHVETFTINVGAIEMDKAHLQVSWEKTMVEVPIYFPTDQLVMESIDQVMSGPSANDYASAATYYFNADKDLNQAEAWMEKALSMMESKPYWILRQQSLIYAANGKNDKAISAAKASLAAAKKAGNADYVKMNEDSLKEWGATN
jgi:hypothetical protein